MIQACGPVADAREVFCGGRTAGEPSEVDAVPVEVAHGADVTAVTAPGTHLEMQPTGPQAKDRRFPTSVERRERFATSHLLLQAKHRLRTWSEPAEAPSQGRYVPRVRS